MIENNDKDKKSNVINEDSKTKNTYDNEMYRPTIDLFVKKKKQKMKSS